MGSDAPWSSVPRRLAGRPWETELGGGDGLTPAGQTVSNLGAHPPPLAATATPLQHVITGVVIDSENHPIGSARQMRGAEPVGAPQPQPSPFDERHKGCPRQPRMAARSGGCGAATPPTTPVWTVAGGRPPSQDEVDQADDGGMA